MIKNCENCGKEFDAKRETARFDTPACRVAYSRKSDTPVYIPPTQQGVYVKPTPKKKSAKLGDDVYEADGVNPIVKKNKSRADAPLVLTREQLRELPGAERKAYLVKELNERMAAKGLPLLSDKPDPVQFIPTGIAAIDGLTVEADEELVGGIPRKHITEVFGTRSAGKSSLMRFISSNLDGLSVLYIDAENGFLSPPEHIVISKATDLSIIDDMVCQALESGSYDVIIVDSVAALTTRKEMEEGKDSMGGKPKAMAAFIRRVNASLRPIGPDGYPDGGPGTAVIFINQLRDTMKSFGVMEYTPGGRSIEYGASLRIELRSAKADRILKENVAVGQKVRVKVEKSRFGPPGTTTAYKMMYKDL